MKSDDGSYDARLRASWDANADAWARAVREQRIESRRLGTDAALVEALVSRGPGRLLDVGCGEGWLARGLARHGFDVLGIDGSERLIASARELGGGDFRVLTYEDVIARPDAVAGPFDYAVCNFSLLSDAIVPLLAALARRLAARGELIIQTVHPCTTIAHDRYEEGWREESFTTLGDGFVAPMPWYFRPLGGWVRELRAAGMTLVDCVEPMHPQEGHPLSLILVARPEERKAPTP